ncbi:MAG: ThiF family adenylyltransferase [Gemmatimonadota bacterium]|jgi:molybdopterin/thiamine biosynthesis adenylyltransferase
MNITYEEMVGRNAGFLSADEQERLRASSVFVCGVGGMGGTAVHALVRAGVGHVYITDPDTFEVSNLNRQVFAYRYGLGRRKVQVTRDALRAINPELQVEIVGDDWVERLDGILPWHRVVVNGMDDVRAGIALYRGARRHEVTVVDAYTSPCPSVTVVAPDDPRPEERLGFPTVGVPMEAIGDELVRASFLREIEYVSSVSSGISRIDPDVVSEILEGRRPRSSFAPLVALSGNLMAFEAIGCLVGRPSGAGCEGYFIDVWGGRVERPEPVQARTRREA